MNKETIRKIVEETDTRAGIFFDVFIQLFIVISITAFTVESLPDLSNETKVVLDWIEYMSIAFFLSEYLLRAFVAKRMSDYIFSFFGIVDFLAIFPTILIASFDFRSVRIFRLLRLFRILKFARYSAAIRRYHLAFTLAYEEIILFLIVAVMMIYLSAVGIYMLENEAQPQAFKSIFHSLWWAVVTLTTVGYGDVYPITVGGKIFTFVMLIVGLGIVSVPAGLLASALSKARMIENEMKDKER